MKRLREVHNPMVIVLELAMVMASLDNGMSLLKASPFARPSFKGLVLLLAVWFDMSRNKGERI